MISQRVGFPLIAIYSSDESLAIVSWCHQ